jgi:hypothetical protein
MAVKYRQKTAEMKFITHTAAYSLLDHTRNEDILELKSIFSPKDKSG